MYQAASYVELHSFFVNCIVLLNWDRRLPNELQTLKKKTVIITENSELGACGLISSRIFFFKKK